MVEKSDDANVDKKHWTPPELVTLKISDVTKAEPNNPPQQGPAFPAINFGS